MNSRLVLTGSLVAAAFIAAACSTTTSSAGPYGAAPASSAAPSSAPIVAPSAPPAAPVASGTAINLASTRLGQVLVDSKGLTVYLFQPDSNTTSDCNNSSCLHYS